MRAFLKLLVMAGPFVLANAGRCTLQDLPDFEPASKVIDHAQAYTAIHPEDPEGWRVLAEIHAVTLLRGIEFVEAPPSKDLSASELLGFYYGKSDRDHGLAAYLAEATRRALAKHGLADRFSDPAIKSKYHDDIMRELGGLVTSHWKYQPPTAAPGASVIHAHEAFRAFGKVLDLAPDDPESRFAAESFAISYSSYRSQAGLPDPPPAPTPEALAREFNRTFELADAQAVQEVEAGNPFPEGPYLRFMTSRLDQLMRDSAEAYIRLVPSGPDRPHMEERLKWLRSVPVMVPGKDQN